MNFQYSLYLCETDKITCFEFKMQLRYCFICYLFERDSIGRFLFNAPLFTCIFTSTVNNKIACEEEGRRNSLWRAQKLLVKQFSMPRVVLFKSETTPFNANIS